MLVWAIGLSAIAQTVTGKVTDADDGSGLPGVNIRLQGTTLGTISDFDGNFSIKAKSGDVLTFSFVGYLSQEATVSGASLNLQLKVDAIGVDEVVVTALGISREKKSLGYSVTEIGGDDVNTVKETNIVNSLAGRVAGVVITKSNSGPGGGSRVVIRGNSSISGNNQPLYVVDGIPVDNSGFGSAAGTGTANYSRIDYGTGISDINPDDIESVTVLKGPNAAALYGSRATNGVIIITTKKGKMGSGLGVSYSMSYTLENPMILPKFQDEYGQGADGNTYTDIEELLKRSSSWGAKMDGSQQLHWTGDTRAYSAQPDNVKDFFQTGSNLVNSLTLEGGNEKSNIRFSYTNNIANSILPESGLNRHNFNLRGFSQISDRLSIDSKVTYFLQDAQNRPTMGTEGIMAYVYTVPRSLDFEDLKDFQNESDYSTRSFANQAGNPYWTLNHDVNDDKRERLNGFAKATFKLTDYLSVFARVGSDIVSQKIESINQVGHWYHGSGRFTFTNYRVAETNADFLFMLDKELSSDIRITANLGGNAMSSSYERMSIYGEDFKIPTKPTTSSARELNPAYTPIREKKINSLYGSASLSYNNMLFLDMSARNDWSSTLPEDNWSYFYPAVSLSFLLSELGENNTVLDYAKLRMSVAKVGNDTDPYQLEIAYDMQQDGYLGLTTLTKPAVKMNPDLLPEQTTSLEFGTEFKLFGNKIYGDLSYYSITSENLIFDVPVSPSTGYSHFRENVGELTNKGFEAMIGGTILNSADMKWDVSLNMATNTNELVELIEGTENFIFTTTNSGTMWVQATVGGGYGDIMGTTYLKNDAGDIVVDDTGRPLASSEKELLGNYQPDWTGGFSSTFSFKDFTFRFLIDARIGGQIYSGTDAALDSRGVSERSLEYRDGGMIFEGVVNTGDADNPVYETNTMTITAQEYWSAHSGIVSNYIYDQTNVRLREVSLTYNLNNIVKNSFVKGASVSLIGRNLFFLYNAMDNFDPESSYSTSNFAQGVLYYTLPSTRSIGFSVNIKF